MGGIMVVAGVCVCVQGGGAGWGVLQKWRGLLPSALYDYIILNVFWLHKKMSAVHQRFYSAHTDFFQKSIFIFENC